MTYFVDRIEGDIMVLENEEEELYTVPYGLFPDAKEGDCLEISFNPQKTEKRREEMRRIMETLFKD